MSEISPSFLANIDRVSIAGDGIGESRGCRQTQMFLLGLAGAGEKVVEDVEASLARGDRSDTTALETMIQEFPTDESRTCAARRLILQFKKEAGFGGGGCRGRLGGGEGVKDKSCLGELGGEWRRGFLQQGRDEMCTNGRLAGTRFSSVGGLACVCMSLKCQVTYKKTTA